MRNRLINLLARNANRGQIRASADDNTIWLYDVIVGSDEEAEWWGGISPEAFAKTLRAMSGPVTIRINSPGGDVFAGVAIAQHIREYADGVTVQIDGLAASIASIIAIAAKEVVASPCSFMMIHKAWTYMAGNSDDLLKVAEMLEKVDDSLADQYENRSSVDETDWMALMTAETWLSADEALALGLVDRLVGAPDPDEDDPEPNMPTARAWDLAAFANLPAALKTPEAGAPARPTRSDIDHEIAARQRQLAVDLIG